MPKADVKLAIRADRGHGVIRAYVSKMDDSERFEVATLNISIADQIDGAFDRWKAVLTEIFGELVSDATGAAVTGFNEFRLMDKN